MVGDKPLVGGGSTAALCGSVAASLVGLVSTISYDGLSKEDVAKLKAFVDDCDRTRLALLKDIADDANCFGKVIKAFKMPKNTDEEKAERAKKIQEGYKYAITSPLGIAEKSFKLFEAIEFLMEYGNGSAETDILTAALCVRTAVLAAVYNIRINLKTVKDEEYVQDMLAKASKIEKDALTYEAKILGLSNLS